MHLPPPPQAPKAIHLIEDSLASFDRMPQKISLGVKIPPPPRAMPRRRYFYTAP